MSQSPPSTDARTAIAQSGYTLKNVKTLDTHDGTAFTATVYKDGLRVGHAENGGTGGPSMIRFLKPEWAAAFDEWAAGQPPLVLGDSEDHEPFTVAVNGESVADELLALWDRAKLAKKLDQQARTALLVRTRDHVDNGHQLEYGLVKAPAGTDPNTAEYRDQCRAQRWWETVTHLWVIGQGWVPERNTQPQP